MGNDTDPKLFTEAQAQVLIAAATATLLVKIEGLGLRIAKMQRDSWASSKPSPSDIAKPPKSAAGEGQPAKKLKPCSQPGHKKHERPWFKRDEINQSWLYSMDNEGHLQPITKAGPNEDTRQMVRQTERIDRVLRIVECRARRHRCIYARARDSRRHMSRCAARRTPQQLVDMPSSVNGGLKT